MERYTKIKIEDLSIKQASLVTDQTINIDGQEIKINQTRVAYVNSELGRQALQADVSEPYLSAVLAVWGDVPTVTEKDGDEK